MRPMQYQQQQQQQQSGFQQNYAANYAQTPAPVLHQQQQVGNPLVSNYTPVPVPPVSRTPVGTAPGNAMTPGNVYNPPRPPEVYTLPDNLNESLAGEVRRCFQHDAAGRVLFFTAPPLDRPHKGISQDSAGLGHSIKYLAGRKEWLAEREKKRKQRDEKDLLESQKRVETELKKDQPSEGDMVIQATTAMSKWFHQLDKDTQRWTKEAGLEGWNPVKREKGMA